jgi:hypothetical protein
VLLVSCAVLLLWQGVPRAKAAWRLQSLATSFADYALCMAGPTGPTLLRDNNPEFWQAVRRRLITSPADSHPFQPCAALAEEVTGRVEVRRAHSARAREFVEYGADAADRATKGRHGEQRLADLEVNTLPLAELAKQARPFLREGYTALVKPSLSAAEATHPAELPQAVVGRGLPSSRMVYRASQALGGARHVMALGSGSRVSAYQTNDGGVRWQPLSVQDPRISAIEGRCFGQDPQRAFAIGLDDSRAAVKVASLGEGGVQRTADLPRGLNQVLAVACDETALVVALARATSAEPVNDEAVAQLFVCAYGGSCQAMKAPVWGEGLSLRPPLDLARTAGTTIIAITRHGLVRTASSRDNGQSWAPFIVAFDATGASRLRVEVPEPSRLLVLGGKRVLLYGGAPRPEMTYPVLASDDLGASWHPPL